MNRVNRFQFAFVSFILCCMVFMQGCGSSNDYLQSATELIERQQSGSEDETSLLGAVKQLASRTDDTSGNDVVGLFEQGDSAQLSEKYDLPSPDRADPFHWESDLNLETRQTFTRSEVLVLGFAGTDEIKVLLSINGQALLLKAGEEADGVMVDEIAPPTAKVTYNGVTWRASLFDERKSTVQ